MGKEKYSVYRTLCPLKPGAALRNGDGYFVLPLFAFSSQNGKSLIEKKVLNPEPLLLLGAI